MAYPSIISQPGSAARNLTPVLNALQSLVVKPTVSSSSFSPRVPITSPRKRKILELASFPYEHIRAYANKWKEVEWWGSGRDEGEIEQINRDWEDRNNLRRPVQLDIGIERDWAKLLNQIEEDSTGPFEGVIMLNLVHCCPEGLPEQVFKHCSPLTEQGRNLLDSENGWIAAYGAYKNDDGSYRSEGDVKFEAEHIRAAHESLGLRTPRSISIMAERWGFVEESRTEMPRGNLWMVWRVNAGMRDDEK